MPTVNELKDIPDSDVDEIAAKFRALGYQVEKRRQNNGKWTLVVTKP